MGAIATYYELLGVDADAPTPVIRDAYRRAARAHHPDRHGDAASSRMAEINRAWQTLGDPERRRQYDLGLRTPTTSGAPSAGRPSPEPPPVYQEPRFNPLARYQDPPRFPWRLMGVLALLGVVLVIVGTVTASDPASPTVDNVLRSGDCVSIEANGDAAERVCTGPHDGVVEQLVPFGSPCPSGTEPHRDQQGMGTACVRLG